jgi:hypothetical protein
MADAVASQTARLAVSAENGARVPRRGPTPLVFPRRAAPANHNASETTRAAISGPSSVCSFTALA